MTLARRLRCLPATESKRAAPTAPIAKHRGSAVRGRARPIDNALDAQRQHCQEQVQDQPRATPLRGSLDQPTASLRQDCSWVTSVQQ